MATRRLAGGRESVMSSTILYFVPETGPVEEHCELSNSWLWCASVWTRCCEKLLGIEGHSWLIGGAAKMFEKISDPTVAYAVRFVLELTCDRALLRRERFLEAASALAEFDVIFPPAGGTHLSAIAKILREAPDRLPDGRWIAGFCITGNSISGYYWNREDAEAPDGRRPFDLSRDTDYFVVGDALA